MVEQDMGLHLILEITTWAETWAQTNSGQLNQMLYSGAPVNLFLMSTVKL